MWCKCGKPLILPLHQESQGLNMVESNEMIKTGVIYWWWVYDQPMRWQLLRKSHPNTEDSFHGAAPISLCKQIVGMEPMRAVWNPQVGVAVSKDSQFACLFHLSWKSRALKSSTVRVQVSFLHVNLKRCWLSAPNWDIRIYKDAHIREATCSLIWWFSHVPESCGNMLILNWPKDTIDSAKS